MTQLSRLLSQEAELAMLEAKDQKTAGSQEAVCRSYILCIHFLAYYKEVHLGVGLDD